MKEITIITCFLNEGEEVYNTLSDLQRHVDLSVCDVLVINDGSDDGIKYDAVMQQFPFARYVKNVVRQGVAACRDLGVALCRTPYFLLLDCHMRFIGQTWLSEVITALKRSDDTLLCCQTRFLRKKDGQLQVGHGPVCGARINFDDPLLGCSWRAPSAADKAAGDLVPIPCVLGAGYAASKAYWQHLKGLEGLKSYGMDEQYISMKVWLSGGRCLLLRHTPIAHIYRYKDKPYANEPTAYFYNVMLLIETLFPEAEKEQRFDRLKQYNTEGYWQALKIFMQHKHDVDKLRKYYSEIFIRDFSDIISMSRNDDGQEKSS